MTWRPSALGHIWPAGRQRLETRQTAGCCPRARLRRSAKESEGTGNGRKYKPSGSLRKLRLVVSPLEKIQDVGCPQGLLPEPRWKRAPGCLCPENDCQGNLWSGHGFAPGGVQLRQMSLQFKLMWEISTYCRLVSFPTLASFSCHGSLWPCFVLIFFLISLKTFYWPFRQKQEFIHLD